MAPQDVLLKKMCSKSETYHAAQSLLRTAQAKTGPGSGHEVGAHSTGLPAICAYLASQELCNNDITESVAQTVSCLKPKDFKKMLNLVRSVLVESKKDPSASPTKTPSKPFLALTRQNSLPKTPTRKRKVLPPKTTIDEDTVILESPTKKRKMADVTVEESDSEVEMQSLEHLDADNEIHCPRRLRPVFLDRKQWFQRDAKLDREWEQAEAHKRSMMALYGHPFEKYRTAQE